MQQRRDHCARRKLRPMRKSVVTTVLTAVFVLYSFYQRAVGVPATADAGPIPAITSPASSSSHGPSVGSTPTPVPKAAQTPTGQPGSPYRDGTYAGAPADAFYGNIQVHCLLYTSDAADDLLCVDLGGRRIIK